MTYWDKKLTKLVQDNQIRHLDDVDLHTKNIQCLRNLKYNN